MKRVHWAASSREELTAFPVELRVRAALALWQLQFGQRGRCWKRAPLVIPGLRVLYLTRRPWRRLVVVWCREDTVVVVYALQSVDRAYSPIEMAELRRRITRLRGSTSMSGDDEPFDALGFAPADAAPLRLRATLLNDLMDVLSTQYCHDREKAARLGSADVHLRMAPRGTVHSTAAAPASAVTR